MALFKQKSLLDAERVAYSVNILLDMTNSEWRTSHLLDNNNFNWIMIIIGMTIGGRNFFLLIEVWLMGILSVIVH